MAANYRAVCRARSKAEFVARMGIVVEEADETILWLELLIESGIISKGGCDGLLAEGARVSGDLYCLSTNGEKGSLEIFNYKITKLHTYPML